MKYLWRRLTRRCAFCGQKLNSKQTVAERLAEINNRCNRLIKRLGHQPQVQGCKKCHRVVFEGERGFVYSLLLIDMELGRCPHKQVAV